MEFRTSWVTRNFPVPAGIEGLRTTTKGKNGEMSRLVGQQNIYIFITYIYNVRPA